MPSTTAYPTTTYPLEWMADPDIEVTAADIDREPCEWCCEDGAVTTVRVYCQAAEDCQSWTREVCGLCAADVIDQAAADRDGRLRTPITVEVAK